MSELTERLRQMDDSIHRNLFFEAAYRIEQLTAEVDRLDRELSYERSAEREAEVARLREKIVKLENDLSFWANKGNDDEDLAV
jgi:hypothetical protein